MRHRKLLPPLLCLLLLLFLPALLAPQTREEMILQAIIDSYIRDQIEDLLGWDSRFEIEDLTVTVQIGMVTVTGRLSSETARQTVTDVIMAVPGVQGVDDRTVVGRGASTRQILEENVREALSTNPLMNRLPIDVRIIGDTLYLSGRVDELWKKRKATELAAGVSGLQHVRNRLLVVPSNDIVDEWVARRILRMLASSRYRELPELTIVVDRGRAVLLGIVGSLEAKRAAYNAVFTTGGIAEIEIRIEIREELAQR